MSISSVIVAVVVLVESLTSSASLVLVDFLCVIPSVISVCEESETSVIITPPDSSFSSPDCELSVLRFKSVSAFMCAESPCASVV
uniref:Putative secreted protein n=1 Tax=Panstrongylus lignarius TaxID=156445 RepID=A0A224XSB4_9HEMI